MVGEPCTELCLLSPPLSHRRVQQPHESVSLGDGAKNRAAGRRGLGWVLSPYSWKDLQRPPSPAPRSRQGSHSSSGSPGRRRGPHGDPRPQRHSGRRAPTSPPRGLSTEGKAALLHLITPCKLVSQGSRPDPTRHITARGSQRRRDGTLCM